MNLERMEAITDSIGVAIEELQRRPAQGPHTVRHNPDARGWQHVEAMKVVVDRPGTEKVTVWIVEGGVPTRGV